MGLLEDRLRRLEDKDEIMELAVRYGLFADNRDLVGICSLFTEDASVRSKDGQHNAERCD